MAATTNNAWPIPVSTDYVKNGWDAINDLGVAIDTSIGTGLLAWQSWTPTITGWTGTSDFRYAQLGKTIIMNGTFTLSSATVTGTSFVFTLPAGKTARVTGNWGTARIVPSTNSTYGASGLASTTTGTVVALNSAGTYVSAVNLATGAPGTWAIGSTISFSLVVEVV